MADDVDCLLTATFGQKPLLCNRVMKCKDFIFDDENSLQTFLTLSELGKQKFNGRYKGAGGDVLDQLQLTWGVDPDFEGHYMTDYNLLHNTLVDERTAWRDIYTTTVFTSRYYLLLQKRISTTSRHS